MGYKVDNAIIMAAGTSSRFAPLSYEKPKALIEVKGEILIERQIRQLQDTGINEIIVVAGYKKEQFEYLKDKFGVAIVENNEYLTRNNNASIYAVKEYLKNTFICSSDNYFIVNPFELEVEDSYYAALYAEGDTSEWCMEEDMEGYITKVTVGGNNSWYMLGHAFWSEVFSSKFVPILDKIYDLPETADMYWEEILMNHMDELKMKIRKYPDNSIFEFDSLDELREFDDSYKEDTRSAVIKSIAATLGCSERDIVDVKAYRNSSNMAAGFRFEKAGICYEYNYDTKSIHKAI